MEKERILNHHIENLKIAKRLIQAIKSETQPIDGHDDPNAINDCWDELDFILDAFDDYLKSQSDAKSVRIKKLDDIMNSLIDNCDKNQ